VLVVAISSSLGGESGQRPPSARSAGVSTPADRGSVPATYVVQSGDTLTSIAHKTGVPVGRIQALNPKIDPQILVSGEKLRLR
jgi:LysM repeat protein